MFSITIDLSTARPLGIEFDRADKELLMVKCVKSNGLVAQHNLAAPADQVVVRGDRLLQVNGNSDEVLHRLRQLEEMCRLGPTVSASSLRLTLHRCKETLVRCKCSSESDQLGVSIKTIAADSSVFIGEILEGMIMDWNTAHPNANICAHDKIVAVDGKGDGSQELLIRLRDRIASQEEFCLTVFSWREH